MLRKSLHTLLVALSLLLSIAPSIYAQSETVAADNTDASSGFKVFIPMVANISQDQEETLYINGGMDPYYVLTAGDIQRLAEKDTLSEQYAAEAQADINAAGVQIKELAIEQDWKEPNDRKHRNYCGPGATQVALDARLAKKDVPSIDTLGSEENIDENWGVTMNAVQRVLNNRLKTSWYLVSGAANASGLGNRVRIDVDSTYAMITGIKTGGMPGWNVNVNHIVASIGYKSSSGVISDVRYTETAAPYAGYNGSFRQWASIGSFWSYVKNNNVQAW